MEIAIPSLSMDGFVTEIRKQTDLMIAHYFASDFSQSNNFYGKITSLAYQVQLYGNDPTRLKAEMEEKLTRYLERYMESAIVEVKINAGTSGSLNRYNIDFDATVVKNGLRYSVGHMIEVQNGRVKSIMNKLQNGEF